MCSCEYAQLVGDARALAQSIAGQMLGSRSLRLFPVPDQLSKEVEHWNGEWIVHHQLKLHLIELPDTDESKWVKKWNLENNWGRG